MCITFYLEATTNTIRSFLKAFPCKQLKNVCLKFLGPLFAFTSTTFYNATFISKPSSLKTSVSVNNTKPNSLIVAENAVQASSSSSRRHNNLNGAVRRTKKPLQHSNSVFSAADHDVQTSQTSRPRRHIEFLKPLNLSDDVDYLDYIDTVTEMTDQEFRSLGFPVAPTTTTAGPPTDDLYNNPSVINTNYIIFTSREYVSSTAGDGGHPLIQPLQ